MKAIAIGVMILTFTIAKIVEDKKVPIAPTKDILANLDIHFV